MYLIDSNIILELLLGRDKSGEVERFLQKIPQEELFITEFSFYSIGIYLIQRKMSKAFMEMVQDLFINGEVQQIRLRPEDMDALVKASNEFSLDFDDAYQYVASEKYNLTLVSLDADFDRTSRGRKRPGDIA
jgi:predicted nucleic acid-binding protein